ETTWVLTSYLVANAVILPMSGWFSSLMVRKRFYLTCVTLFTVSSVLCGLAPSLGWLIFFRVLQGLGGGGLQPTAQALLMENFPPEKHGQAMAVYGMGVVFAPVIGPVLGGWLTDNFSWRWIFLINLPVGILSFALSSALLSDPPFLKRISLKSGRIDYIGFGLIALGLGALEIVLDEGQRHDWFASPFIVAFAIVGVLAIILVVFNELRHEHPVVNLRLLKNGNFATSSILLLFLGFVLYGSTFLIPLFLQTLLGFDATTSGLALSPGGIVILVTMPFVGMLVRKVDPRWLMGYGLFTTGLGLFMMSHYSLDTGLGDAVVARMVQSLGLAALFIPTNVAAYSSLKHEEIGQASGLLNLFRNFGGSMGIAMLSTLLARRTQFHQARLVEHLAPGQPAYEGFVGRIAHSLAQQGYSALDALHRAQAMLYGRTLQQARLLAFTDVFWVAAIICFALILGLLLLRKSKVDARLVEEAMAE
ncbi:MAG TPA: DHA2 family efflux MFS transporter permease subunit, partial [Holophagaceae bacterium]|nr:DHA2 family efflux MFS transporter permease subunit [Holophagaceae bacterium]